MPEAMLVPLNHMGKFLTDDLLSTASAILMNIQGSFCKHMSGTAKRKDNKSHH